MAAFLTLLITPIWLLFNYIRIKLMGGSSSKPVAVPEIQENSSGFHILEFHTATISIGFIVLAIIIAIYVAVCYCLRSKCKKSIMRQYFGTQAQLQLPLHIQAHQQLGPNPAQMQAIALLPLPRYAPPVVAAPPLVCHDVVPYKPGHAYLIPPGT